MNRIQRNRFRDARPGVAAPRDHRGEARQKTHHRLGSGLRSYLVKHAQTNCSVSAPSFFLLHEDANRMRDARCRDLPPSSRLLSLCSEICFHSILPSRLLPRYTDSPAAAFNQVDHRHSARERAECGWNEEDLPIAGVVAPGGKGEGNHEDILDCVSHGEEGQQRVLQRGVSQAPWP